MMRLSVSWMPAYNTVTIGMISKLQQWVSEARQGHELFVVY
jgi:hypothetical protein